MWGISLLSKHVTCSHCLASHVKFIIRGLFTFLQNRDDMTGWLLTCLNRLLEIRGLLYVAVHLGCFGRGGGWTAAQVRQDEILLSM